MLNFIPKRDPSRLLLFGKRALQRIEVGRQRARVEIPLPIIERLYAEVDEKKELHNGDYNALRPPAFYALKSKALHLVEAANSPGNAARSALDASKMASVFERLDAAYRARVLLEDTCLMQRLGEAADAKKPRLQLPIREE